MEYTTETNLYLVGSYERNTSVDTIEYWGSLVKHETYSYEATIESVWIEVAGSDIEITDQLSEDQKKKLKEEWESHLDESDPEKSA